MLLTLCIVSSTRFLEFSCLFHQHPIYLLCSPLSSIDHMSRIRASASKHFLMPLYMVDSIKFKKSIGSKQHEYILVRVCHPDSTRFAMFIVDRCPSSKISVQQLMSSQSQSSGF